MRALSLAARDVAVVSMALRRSKPQKAVDGLRHAASVIKVSQGRTAMLERFQWSEGDADIWRVFADADSLRAVVEDMVAPWRGAGVTHVAGAEARGFLLGAPCALALNVGFLAIRKDQGGLLPGEKVSAETAPDYRGNRHTLRMQRVLGPEDRVLLVDDWAERGSQALTAKSLIEQCGAHYLGLTIIVDELTEESRQALGPVTSLVTGDELDE